MTGKSRVLLPRDAADRIDKFDTNAGVLGLQHHLSEDLYVVTAVGTREIRTPVDRDGYDVLQWSGRDASGQWLKLPGSDINLGYYDCLRKGAGVGYDFEGFRALVPGVIDPGTGASLVVTYVPDQSRDLLELGVPEFAAWYVSRDGVQPYDISTEQKTIGLQQLTDYWPLEELASARVAVVGVGSIGGATVEALAAYGVGTIHLIDPDRFLWHNMVRHVLGRESVGRYKVDALKKRVNDRWPGANVINHQQDVVDDAHYMRALFTDIDIVICAADGISPRRVVSHLARRAGIPSILACVLDDGAVGEVVRLKPAPKCGCLLCLRAHLQTQGVMDVEAAQELDYGTGQSHRPMTAVGPDLHLVGALAAKTAVATILEAQHGDHTQRLPGNLAVVGLRPAGDLAAPFDLSRSIDIHWTDVPPPRTDCPTCSPTR